MKKLTDKQISHDILRGLKDKKKFALRWSNSQHFYVEVEATDEKDAREMWESGLLDDKADKDKDNYQDDLEIEEIDE